jgi:primosomal protein N' (replication factor Y)
MPYFDILFPLNLGLLTYRCPEDLLPVVQPGTIVSAPIKNRLSKGIVVCETPSPPPGKIKDISRVHGDGSAVGKGLLKLLLWMADYYLAPGGAVLKQTLPKELFTRTKARETKKKTGDRAVSDLIDIPDSDLAELKEAARRRKYATFLLHSPSWLYEYSIVPALIGSGAGKMIVILPEVAQAESLYFAVRAMFGERICLFHGGMAKGRRSERIEGIISGKHDVVVGTRSALFAPLKTVSMIIVLHEHSGSYKLDEGLRYQVRDVAVMRGFLEKSAVLLSSITPSVDSYFNALSGKYVLLRPKAEVRRPKVRVVDMRFEKVVRANISKAVFVTASERLKAGGKVTFVVNRKGYATLLLCRDCGRVEECGQCAIPLVHHKDDGVLRCRYCGAVYPLPERCSRCGGHHLELLGSGTQRVQEDIEELLGVKTIRFDSDRLKRASEIEDVLADIAAGSASVVIGTKMMTRRLGRNEKFSAAVVLNIDALLNFPDFRASEKAYLELSSILERVEPSGEMLVQTRVSGNVLLKHFRAGDYLSFVRDELSVRKELRYPPYAKLLSIRCSGERLAGDIVKTISGRGHDIAVFGPVATKERRGDYVILLKSGDRKTLRAAAREVLGKYQGGKARRVVIDVDPA